MKQNYDFIWYDDELESIIKSSIEKLKALNINDVRVKIAIRELEKFVSTKFSRRAKFSSLAKSSLLVIILRVRYRACPFN